jgi:hypothetical protein
VSRSHTITDKRGGGRLFGRVVLGESFGVSRSID